MDMFFKCLSLFLVTFDCIRDLISEKMTEYNPPPPKKNLVEKIIKVFDIEKQPFNDSSLIML